MPAVVHGPPRSTGPGIRPRRLVRELVHHHLTQPLVGRIAVIARVPEHIDDRLRDLHGTGRGGQPGRACRRSRRSVGARRRSCRWPAAPVPTAMKCGTVSRNRRRMPRLDDLIHHAMAGAPDTMGHMLGGAELADRHARAGQRMIVTKDAYRAVRNSRRQKPAFKAGRKPIARSTRPRSILVLHIHRGGAHRADGDARRHAFQRAHQPGQEIGFAHVVDADHEAALAARAGRMTRARSACCAARPARRRWAGPAIARRAWAPCRARCAGSARRPAACAAGPTRC